MRSILKVSVILAAIALCLGGGSRAFAQQSVTATVPFDFVVSGTTHTAGTYDLRLTNNDQTFEFKGPSRNGGFAEVMTRIAGPEIHGSEGRLVFDHVGGLYYLSEVWLPDQEGFLLYAVKEPHTHHAVKLHKQT